MFQVIRISPSDSRPVSLHQFATDAVTRALRYAEMAAKRGETVTFRVRPY